MASSKSPAISTNVQQHVLPWTTAKLVPELLEYNLHVLEDEDMIRWLGRESFVHTCINGPLGWQDKVNVIFLIPAPPYCLNIHPFCQQHLI
jgi:hypothetical protein